MEILVNKGQEAPAEAAGNATSLYISYAAGEKALDRTRTFYHRHLGTDPAHADSLDATAALMKWANQRRGFQYSRYRAQFSKFVVEIAYAALWLGWLRSISRFACAPDPDRQKIVSSAELDLAEWLKRSFRTEIVCSWKRSKAIVWTNYSNDRNYEVMEDHRRRSRVSEGDAIMEFV
jgi:hypothetical protein